MTKTNQLSPSESAVNEDNRILELVLTKEYRDGGFTVVSPNSSSNMDSPDDLNSSREFFLESLANTQVAPQILAKLVDLFIRKNEKSVPLTLVSQPKKGYIVDYERKFLNYFHNDNGGWERWHEENPKAHCSTSVSLPAYDKEHELVLVYVGQQCDWLMGSGYLFLFKKEGEKLEQLGSVMLWIS